MNLNRPKIILVDDIQFHLLSTKERFKHKYDIYTARSSEELFDLLLKITPSAILLDINMPDEDGFEILIKLKSDERYLYTPVLFLTAQIDRASIIKGMTLGAMDIIAKPFTDPEFIECIEQCINPVKYYANKPVILAVDDNPSELQTIHFFLNEKYTVYTLPDPGRINDLLKMISPDLILLDCQMPVIGGFDLVPVIRNIPRYEETPIIFVTALGSIDNISVAMHLGACDFVVKPIDEAVLKEKVALHLLDYIMRRRIRDFASQF